MRCPDRPKIETQGDRQPTKRWDDWRSDSEEITGSLGADERENIVVHQIGMRGTHAMRQVLVDLESPVF